jgi:hypothetical protein
VRDEVGDARDRQRDVVLDVLAGAGLGQRDVLAQLPQAARLRDRGGDHGVVGQAALPAPLRSRFQQADRVLFRFAARHFQQRVLRMAAGERPRQVREVLADQAQAEVRHQLVAGQAGAALVLHQRQQGQRASRRIQATSAVIEAFGCGNSFSTAAVITPSVPSAPMNRSRRS